MCWCTSYRYVWRKYFIDIIVIIVVLVLWHVLYHWHGAVKNLYPLYFSCPIKSSASVLVVLEIWNLTMLNDIDASFVSRAIALCLKKKMKICCWTKEWYKWRPQYTHNDHMTDLRLSEPNYYIIFCGWMAHLLSYMQLLPLTITKKTMWEKKSLSIFIHYSRLFGHWKWFWKPEIHVCYVSSLHWRHLYCLTDRW